MIESETIQGFIETIKLGNDDATEAFVSTLTSELEPELVGLANSPDLEERWWAVRALALCGTEHSVPTLVSVLIDPDPSLRAGASLSIGHIYQRRPNMNPEVFTQVARLLADDDGLVRQTVADALAMCGDDAVAALEAILDGTHDGARTRAAYALRKIATLRAAPALYRHLNDPNYLVRTYVYEALDDMGLLENILVSV